MKHKPVFAKILRILTVAPVMAGALILILSGHSVIPIGRALFYLLFLCGLPLLAYPVSLLWGRKCSRERQRNLAICFSVAGYAGGMLWSLLSGGSTPEKAICMTYLLSGILTAVCSFLFRIRASGHACGVSGPVAALCVFASPVYALGFALLIPVCRASLQLKRHTVPELLLGTVIPIVCLALSLFLFRQAV